MGSHMKRLIDANALGRNTWLDGTVLVMAVSEVDNAPTVDAVEVVHGRWILEAHEEYANYRWNVTAECSECHAEKKEVYVEFISGFHKDLAEQIVLEHAESVKLQNYCPNCGADMRGENNDKE